MEKTELNRAIQAVKARGLQFFVPLDKARNGGLVCPICGSGTGPKGTGGLSISTDTGTEHITCFAHGCFGERGCDVPEALCRIWGYVKPDGKLDYTAMVKRAGEKISQGSLKNQGRSRSQMEPVPHRKVATPTEAPKAVPAPPPPDYTACYQEWSGALRASSAALDYLNGRGISLETAEHFRIGFAAGWLHPNRDQTKPAYPEDRLIIPESAYSYKARRIGGQNRDGGGKYKLVGSKSLFNVGGINPSLPVIVTEGELDAATIWQGGGVYQNVLALGSTGNKDLFLNFAADHPGGHYILLLDNDETGKRVQEETAGELKAAQISFTSADSGKVCSGKKDANEAVTAGGESRRVFWNELAMLCAEAGEAMRQKRLEAEIKAYQESGPGMVDEFCNTAQTEKYKPFPTGFGPLDTVLNGGFMRGTLTIIAAGPGVGKTTLACQVLEGMAAQGHDVLYINLEMSRDQLLARSLSRITARQPGYSTPVPQTAILQGYKWDEETRDRVFAAAEEYKRTIAGHLIYNPGKVSNDLQAIMATIRQEQARLGHAPIVAVDYLQVVSSSTGGRADDVMEGIKHILQTLKDYAIEANTMVFVLAATNRASMSTGDAGLNSARDSSNVEFCADQHIGLEYAAVAGIGLPENEKPKTPAEIRKYRTEYFQNPDSERAKADYEMYCRRFALRLNKNRFGYADVAVLLDFDGEASRFIPVTSDFDDVK